MSPELLQCCVSKESLVVVISDVPASKTREEPKCEAAFVLVNVLFSALRSLSQREKKKCVLLLL